MISCFSTQCGIETFRVDPSALLKIEMHTTFRVKALLIRGRCHMEVTLNNVRLFILLTNSA